MEDNSNKKMKTITAIAIILFIGVGAYAVIEGGRNNKLKDELKEGKLNSETLLSEKLSLDKEISKLKLELKTLKDENSELNKSVIATTTQLEKADEDLKRIQGQNVSVAQLKRQNQELRKIKDDLELQVAHLKASLGQLQNSNEDLKKTLTLLQDENTILKEELNAARMSSINDALVETANKNRKLTVKAARTRNITLTVDVPAEVENLRLKVTGPDGRELPSADGDVAVKLISAEVKKPQAFYVAPGSAAGRQYKKVEMVYRPKTKLSAGVYKVEVLDEFRSIGGLQVKLR